MIKKSLISLLLTGIFIGLLAGCGGLPKSAVAEVNGKVITKEDLDKQIENVKAQSGGQGVPEPGTPEYREMEKQLIQELVTRQILAFEADELDIEITDEEINERLDQTKNQLGGEEQFKAALESQNFTEARLKEEIRLQILSTKLFNKITEGIEITDEEVLDFYTENQTGPLLQLPATKTVRHILVADEATAAQVKNRLDAGEDFAVVAQEVSIDELTKIKGGDLGKVTSEGTTLEGQSLDPTFVQAMNQLAQGQISGPVKTQFGVHIIQVTKISPAGTPPLEEVKDQLRQNLLQQKQQEVAAQWLEDAMARYEITYDPAYDPNIVEETPTVPDTSTAPTSTTPTGAAPATPAQP